MPIRCLEQMNLLTSWGKQNTLRLWILPGETGKLVPMNEEDKDKTAFITPKGLYQFREIPFGLCGAPAAFQRMMDRVVRGLESVYLDDVVIFSETWDDYIQHVREVLKRLREYKLTAKPTKCQFGMHGCVYLG